MNSFRIGLIGAGAVYRRLYRPAIARTHELEALAIADPLSAQSGPGPPAYAAAEDMVAQTALDGVIVLSPPEFHAAHVELGSSRGLRVLVEKPPALSVSEVEAWTRPELVTPAFSRRYARRYQARAGSGRKWDLVLQTNPAAWGALAAESVERDLLPHAADLAMWLSGETILLTTDVVRTAGRATGLFELSAGGRFRWEVAHGDEHRERLTVDGVEMSTETQSLTTRLLRRLRRAPEDDVAAISRLLRDWAALAAGHRPMALPTVEDARSCAAVIEAVERIRLSDE